jgi:hypothetical protein
MIKILIPIFTVVLLSGCATAMPGTQVEGAAGFFAGFWHGVIAIYSLIGHFLIQLLLFLKHQIMVDGTISDSFLALAL